MILFTEKLFYISLITFLAILGIILPISIIQTGKMERYIYLSKDFKEFEDKTNSIVEEESEKSYVTSDKLINYFEQFINTRKIVFSKKSLGKSYLKNTIYEIVLSQKGLVNPRILIVSGILAKDWDSIWTSIQIMKKFYKDFTKTSKLLRQFSFHFIPLLNPDGYNLSRSLPIFMNWDDNFITFDGNKEPKGKSILNGFKEQIPESIEGKLFKTYFQESKDLVKAVFFLFSSNDVNYDHGYYSISKKFIGKDSHKKILTEVLKNEDENAYYKYSDEDEPDEGRIDQWVSIYKQPPILVVNLRGNYQAGPPENLQKRTKMLASNAYSVITTLLEKFSQFF